MARRAVPPPIAVSDAGGVRTLHIGGIAVQSAMKLGEPDALQLDYTRCMMAFLLFHPEPREALLPCLGGGSIAKFLHRHFRALRTRVVEVDARVVAVARSQFALPPDDARLRVEVGDGAKALTAGCCDLLVADAFDDEAPAPQLAGEDFYAAARDALAERGVLVANLISDDPALDARLRAMERAFGGAVVCLPALSDPNLLVFGLKGMAPRMPWAALRVRARELQARYGLPFPKYASALRRMNESTSRELVIAAGA